jgi:hypothetical protein
MKILAKYLIVVKIVKTEEYEQDFSILKAEQQKQVKKIEDKINAVGDPTLLDFAVKKSPLPEVEEYSIAVSDALVFITFRIENNKCVLIDVI